MNKKTLIASLFALFVVASLAGWFVLRAKVTENPMQNPVDKPVSPVVEKNPETPQDVSSVDTSDWKTYRNEEYGFEVKYPGEWEIRKEEEKNIVVSFLFGEKGKKYGGVEYGGGDAIILSFKFKSNPLLENTDNILEKWKRAYGIQTQEITVNNDIVGIYYTGFGEGMLIGSIPGKNYEFSISSAFSDEVGVRDVLMGMMKSLHFFGN